MEKVVPIIDIPYNKIAKRVITCGDPERAEKIAGRLDDMEVVKKSREYWTFNGVYKGVPVTVSSHGVGGNGASVSFEGLILGGAKVIIRVGTCGTLQKDIPQSSLIIATAACREDGITSQFGCSCGNAEDCEEDGSGCKNRNYYNVRPVLSGNDTVE